MSVLQRRNEDNRAFNLFKYPHLTNLSCCGFLQVSSRRLTGTGRPGASPKTTTGMALMMASWRTSCWCRQDAGKNLLTSTWYASRDRLKRHRMFMHIYVNGAGRATPALSIWLFSFFFSLCLSPSFLRDDFTEPRNLKLSLGLQPASEKPINSSFKPFVPLARTVCVSVLVQDLDSLMSSLSVVSDSRHSS